MIGKTKIVKQPYIVQKPFRFEGKQYNVGDIFSYNPNFAKCRNLLKIRVIKPASPEECEYIAPHNNFLFKGVTYSRGQIIPSEEMIGFEKLVDKGIVEKKLKSDIKKEDIKKESSKTKYSELAKQIGISTSDLFIELRKNPKIDKIFGEKNPHHMSVIPEEIEELIELGK
jgi:hypothetical protein